VVGLGNPGREYIGTRHNVGFAVIDELVRRHDGRLRKGKERALVDELRVDGQRVVVAQPQTYMNLSGESVTKLVRRFDVEDLHRLVVVHDELDLPVGRLKVKVGGGLAGHNGLRSIKSHLRTDDFVRIRIGVGKPPAKEHGADHVLSRMGRAERTVLEEMVDTAADAVESILRDGVEATMGRFNAATA
jgi:peptidyl-tRNA hydrolase, PTH1 family